MESDFPLSPGPLDLTWLKHLSRAGWAWEFLRRNQRYQLHFKQQAMHSLSEWGLLYFEDPELDSRHAAVFWHPDICSTILPITAIPLEQPAGTLDLEKLKCSVKIIPSIRSERSDVLFRQEGRQLQIALDGARTLVGMQLMASVVPMPQNPAGRVLALRRFANLVTSSNLQPNLYPAERRVPRLLKVLQALELWLAQRSYRDIAICLYGESRVDREWNDPRENLRDQVRRAVHYGRGLMEGGYRHLLR